MILSEGARALERGGGLRERWLEHRTSLRAAVASIIAGGIESGDVRSDLPAEVLAEYLLGMLKTRAWELEDEPEMVRSDASIVDLFIHGVAGPAAPQCCALPKS